jgi:hypothetical protein
MSPSILNLSLPNRASSTEPQAKRQRPEDSAEGPSSIMTRLSTNVYHSIDEVLEDVDSAVSDVIEKLQLPNGAARNQYIPIPAEQSDLAVKISAFKKRAHDLVRRENAAKEKQSVAMSNGSTSTAGYVGNGGLGSNAFTQINANSGDSKLVLTLYGNAPGPKQLFSSLQKPNKLGGEYKGIVQPLREAGLPNGITTTQIVPIQSTGLIDDRKRVATLGEVFPTPATVQPLQPPKPSKIATTRSSIVGWYQPATADLPPRNGSYFRQSISTGQWLDYSNASPSQGTKRKQRDRALSLTSTKAPLLDVEPVDSETMKLDALFRSAYSGFAPTKDDAAAIAPGGLINRMWWQQIGEKNFERFVENANNLEGALATDLEGDESAIADDANEIEKFQEVVEYFEEEAIDPSLVSLEAGIEKSAREKDVEEILEGISELLETLNSYQRIRHMSLNPSSRPVGLLSAPDITSLGTPSKPSDPEQATYEILKSQLTLMISSLPPYAIAKLDSDRLADLSISTKMEIRMEDYNGVMEEDEASARAKVVALSAASTRPAPPSALHHRTSSSALYGNQYAQPRSGGQTPHQYYGSTQTPVRPPSNNVQRPPATAPMPYQSQRPAASAPYRPQYGTPTYPHQAPRPAQPSYTQSNQPQYLHTPGSQNYMRGPSQTYQNVPQSAPQAPMNGRYPGQPPYPHQTQVSQNGGEYRYGNGANMGRQTSPQKPMYSPQQASAPRPPSYSTPTPAISQDRRPYMQNPMMNGGNSQSPQPQYTQTTGLTNYSTFMTQEQQSSMMERQRAQLAQQQGTQQQARNAAQAGAMGSPSKTQVNGASAVAAGL